MYNTALRKRQRLEAKTGANLVNPFTKWPAGGKTYKVTVTHTVVKEGTFVVTATNSVDAGTFARALMTESSDKKVIKANMTVSVSREFNHLRKNGDVIENTQKALEILRPGGFLGRFLNIGRFFK